MFNPTTETGKGWDGDIRDDVILEVSFNSFIKGLVQKLVPQGYVF